MPVDRASFTRALVDDGETGLQFMLTSDTLTSTVTAAAIWVAHTVGNLFYVTLDDERLGYVAAGGVGRCVRTPGVRGL